MWTLLLTLKFKNMIRLIIFTVTFLFTVLASAQVSENRTVSNFSKIKVSTSIDLVFTQDSKTSVKVEADDAERLQAIVTKVSGNTLEVYVNSKNLKGKKNRNFKTLKVWVSASLVDSFQASSSSSVALKNGIEVKTANVEVSSSADFNGKIKADEINLSVSSSGALKSAVSSKKLNVEVNSSAEAILSGTAENTNVSASSSADFQGKELTVKNAIVEVSSSAEVVLTITESLKAKATSSGSVSYYGNPKNVDSEKNSSGSIIKK